MHFSTGSPELAYTRGRVSLVRPTTYRQAMIALTCGFAASLVVICVFVYLIVHDHPKTAYVLISSLFAGTIIRLVRHRRRQGSLRETQDQE
jgi:hypothetical protein